MIIEGKCRKKFQVTLHIYKILVVEEKKLEENKNWREWGLRVIRIEGNWGWKVVRAVEGKDLRL